jgi:hypothetical protein
MKDVSAMVRNELVKATKDAVLKDNNHKEEGKMEDMLRRVQIESDDDRE